MKKILICFGAIFFPILLKAQGIRIDEIWRNIENKNIAKQEQLKVSIQQQELRSIQQNKLPLFYVDGNLQRNLVIPTTPVPAIAFDPNAVPGAITPLKFATKWSSKAGVQLEWKIFDPSNRGNINTQKLRVEKAKISEAQRKYNWKKDATLAYTAVVLASLQYQSAIADSTHYGDVLKTVIARYNAGRATNGEYIDAQQEAERRKIQIYEAWLVLKEASLDLENEADTLKFSQLSSGIEDIARFVTSQQIENRYDQQNLALDARITQMQLDQFRNQKLPTLGFNVYYGAQFFDNKFSIFESDNWFGNSYANLTLRIPLSNYFFSNPQEKKASLQAQLDQLTLKDQITEDNLVMQKKLQKKIIAEQKIASYLNIMQLAKEQQITQLASYQAGRLLISDYNVSLAALNKAKKDLWQAQYDYIKLLLE